MPQGDRKGPRGEGPMTGRGAGLCAGNASPGYMNAGGGRGGRRGAGLGGRGRGFRGWFLGTGLPGWMRFGAREKGAPGAGGGEDEVKLLKKQSEYLARALEEVTARLSALERKEP